MLDVGRPRTVELFAGIGGFRSAADELALSTVWANDMDPFASSVYRTHHGDDSLVEADIHSVLDLIPDHDILTAGFPCQPFSYAGKKRGTRDDRASTFDAILQVLERRHPPVVVLENVKSILSIAYGRYFSDVLGRLNDVGYTVEWRVRNAIDVGLPQNRKRVLMLAYPTAGSDPAPILGRDADLVSPHQEGAISARRTSYASWGVAYKGFYTMANDRAPDPASAPPMESILEADPDPRFDFSGSIDDRIAQSKPVDEMIDGVEVLWNQEGGRRMGYTIYGTRGVSPTLTCTTSRHYERYRVGDTYRRLTPVEYARLQGFDDHHCDSVPLAKRYVLFGNAIPPPLAAWALRRSLECLPT